MSETIFYYVCLGVIGFVITFICIVRFLFKRKVRQARYIANIAIKGETDVDEHDIRLAIDILQNEWERKKLSGKEAHEDGVLIYKLADIYLKQIPKSKNEKEQ